MGLVCCTSRGNGEKRMGCLEATVCAVVEYTFPPMEKMGREGTPREERFQILEALRSHMLKINSPDSLTKQTEGFWTTEELQLPRRCGSGGPVRVLFGRPAREPPGRDLPLVVGAHSGGLVCGCPTQAELVKALKGAAEAAKGDTGDRSSASSATTDDEGRPALCCWASVDYRLAPEAHLRDAIDDLVSAYLALAEPANADQFGYSRARMGLAGCSAGGVLAAHAALRLGGGASLEAPPPAFMMLDYPMLDPAMDTRSWAAHGDGRIVHRNFIRQCWQWSLAGPEEGAIVAAECSQWASPIASASWAEPRLKGMRALILLGCCDPLHDEGLALAGRLKDAGIQVQVVEAAGNHCTAHMFDKEAAGEFHLGLSRLLTECSSPACSRSE